MYKVMIVEDDEIISNSIAGYLNKWQYTTHEVSNFQNVITEFVEEKPDIVLMDINLPYFDGYYFCEEIRKISKVPIIFISSASDDMNIVMAMNIGADDFIEKPFKLVVLKAKIEALLRRVYNFNSSNSLIVYKEVIFDINKDEIKYKDNVAALTKNESKILTILLENREKIVSREDIIAALWQSDNFIDENTLSVNVNRLRSKLKDIFIFVLIFYLYNLPFEALFYSGLLCFVAALITSIIDFNNYRKSYIYLKHLESNILNSMEDLPKSLDIRVEYYQKIIERLHNEVEKLKIEDNKKMEGLVDYYSMWIHQIKTPIAAINFLLDNEEIDVKAFRQELFKIERYVEMVLTYIRLGSETSDYVITSINLDEVVRENIKKYATLFINKKIKLNYVSHETYVISDKKWLGFAFEQLLSNAIKYTKSGGEISINISESKLIIEDNGIGIYEEDLPRIFEQSFTGLNGRYEKKSSGLGLYLCKKTLDKLQHKIEITSEINKGTKVEVTFPVKDTLRD